MADVKIRDTADRTQNAVGTVNNKPAPGKRQQEVELNDVRLLQKLSVELGQEVETGVLYKKIVDAAVAIMGSQCASMQMLYPDPGSSGKLHIVACNGFTPEAEKYWEWVYHYTGSTCGEVLRTRRRVVVPDFRTCAFMQDAPTLPVFIESGIFAAQSTPLYSTTGQLLGMISTHWTAPHTPAQHQLDMLDILARQAAGLIKRTQTTGHWEK